MDMAHQHMEHQKMLSRHVKQRTKGLNVEKVTAAVDDFHDTVNAAKDIESELSDVMKGGDDDAVNQGYDSDTLEDYFQNLVAEDQQTTTPQRATSITAAATTPLEFPSVPLSKPVISAVHSRKHQKQPEQFLTADEL
jgi:hypothetical protein